MCTRARFVSRACQRSRLQTVVARASSWSSHKSHVAAIAAATMLMVSLCVKYLEISEISYVCSPNSTFVL